MGMTGGYVAKYSCDCCNKAVEISNDYFEKNDAAWSDYIQTANLAGQALERILERI